MNKSIVLENQHLWDYGALVVNWPLPIVYYRDTNVSFSTLSQGVLRLVGEKGANVRVRGGQNW